MKTVKPNHRTAPLGVLLVAGLPDDQAAVVVEHLDTTAIIIKALLVEIDGRCRPAVIMALAERLSMLK